jgi:hypothetical protein
MYDITLMISRAPCQQLFPRRRRALNSTWEEALTILFCPRARQVVAESWMRQRGSRFILSLAVGGGR